MQKNIAVQDLKIRHDNWDEGVYFAVRGKNDKGVWGHYSQGSPGGIAYEYNVGDGWKVYDEVKISMRGPGLYVARENMHIDFAAKEFDGKIGIPKGAVFYLEQANPKLWAPLLEAIPSHDGPQWIPIQVAPEK